MFENEGTEIESTQSDVTPETSSESQTDAQTDAAQPGQEAQAAAPQKEVPFHEHPRWKEVMEERNAERQARAQLEAQLQQMQRQIQEASRPKSTQPDFREVSQKMQERLKGIDPEYQQYMSMLEQQALSAREELRQFREEQFVNRAVSKFEELNKANNVPQELAPVLRAQLDYEYSQGKIRSLGDLEKAYKAAYEPLNKIFAERERQALAKYTADKKAAAAKPAAQPKGKAAAPGQPRASTNPTDQRASIIKEAVTQLRASRDLG